MTEFQRQCKKSEETKAKFPEGSRIYIDHISDNSYPKAVGKYATVVRVDDASQVFVKTEEGYMATVCAEYGDVFFKVPEDAGK